MDTIKEFHLVRIEDETGISGTGIVARGVVLPSGAVVMEWQTFHSSICVYKNIGDVEAIHGHNGKTLLVMGSPVPTKKEYKCMRLPSGGWQIYDAKTGAREKETFRTRTLARAEIDSRNK